jgi:hypothetical protein
MEVVLGSAVVEHGMRAFRVVVAAPRFRADTGFLERGKEFSIEVFTAQGAVEALPERVLPWAARVDIVGLHAHLFKPGTYGLGNEFGAVV